MGKMDIEMTIKMQSFRDIVVPQEIQLLGKSNANSNTVASINQRKTCSIIHQEESILLED